MSTTLVEQRLLRLGNQKGRGRGREASMTGPELIREITEHVEPGDEVLVSLIKDGNDENEMPILMTIDFVGGHFINVHLPKGGANG